MAEKRHLKTFLFSYSYAGAWYSLEIVAYTAEEAQDRLVALTYAKYDGELAMKIPAYLPCAGIFARIYTWFRNLW